MANTKDCMHASPSWGVPLYVPDGSGFASLLEFGSLGELKWKLDTLRECFLLSLLTMFCSISS